VDLVPAEYEARQIARAFAQYQSIENLRLLLLRAEVADRELPKQLEEMGAIVDDIACYRTVAETEDVGGASARLLEAGADWLTFTSGSTVRHFHARFNLPDLRQRFPGLQTASIGPETSRALAECGMERTVEAQPHTIESLVEALVKATRRR
jgi:uroporphyrinogen-III synthase